MHLKINRFYLVIISLGFSLMSCKDEKSINLPVISSDELHNANIALEQDIVHDFFSPPVAGRIYLYPNLTAYEILSKGAEEMNSLKKIISNFPQTPTYKGKHLNDLAAIYSFCLVARELVYTPKHIDLKITKIKEMYGSHKEFSIMEKYSQEFSKIMIAWFNEDMYNETRNMVDYTLLGTPGSWSPTPPDYMDALEPHWDKIRTIVLDSSSQFSPPEPTTYDMTSGSKFHAELIEVYDAVKNNDSTTIEIAKFWDCNPIVTKHKGHITYSEKKLTPGGHWMNICRATAVKEKLDLNNTSLVYASITIGMFDAFISCWEGKYRTNYIRPVTVIQNDIDPSWMPILTTPNFPEYTSGHSVVSRSASTVLTYFFGDNYSFTDSTEVPYGMPPRTFTSFFHASDEAAISRFYGGIHYKPGIYDGVEQGKKIGALIVSKIRTLKK